jgi:hypothetical protein
MNENISLAALPQFHRMINEVLDTFIFEFESLCSTYEYNNYAQLIIFPSILKEISLKWFIGLDIHNI